MFFKPDGTKMYVVGSSSDTVHQYSLSTPWDISTTSYDSVSYNLNSSGYVPIPSDIFFKPDGTKMWVVDYSSSVIRQYSLSTPWDVSSVSNDFIAGNVYSQDQTPQAVYFPDDGTKMYVLGPISDRVHQFSIEDITSLTFPASVQNPPTEPASPDNRTTYTFFTSDGGTNVYLIGEEVL